MTESNKNFEELYNRPSMAIIIDCWKDFESDIQRQTMKNIQKHCFDNPWITTIGQVSYIGMTNELVAAEDPWFTNGKELFYDTVRWETLRRLWEHPKFVRETVTHNLILNMPIREDQIQFSFWDNLQLLYYCNHINPSIKNIYLFGFAWDNCMKARSLGWVEVQNLNTYDLFISKKNIFSNLTCTLNMKKERVTEVSSPWVKIKDDYVMIDNSYTL